MSQQSTHLTLFQRFTAKLAASRFLTTSLLIHVLLVSLVGTVVLFKATQPQEAMMAVGTDGILSSAEEETPGETEEQSEFIEEAATPPSPTESVVSPASAISSLTDAPTAWATSSSSDYQLMGNSLSQAKMSSSSLSGGGGGSPARPSAGGGGRMTGTLYGVKIETNKLGVLVDVSGSAHPFLHDAFRQIEKFKDPVIVLQQGCSVGIAAKAQGQEEIAPAKSFGDRYETDAGEIQSIFGALAVARRNEDLDRQLKKLFKRDDVFLLAKKAEFAKSKDVPGGEAGFRKLMASGVDTIYWFADFADPVQANLMKEIIAEMNAKKIRLIAHNFSGKPLRPALEKIVKDGGGEVIVTIPKK